MGFGVRVYDFFVRVLGLISTDLLEGVDDLAPELQVIDLEVIVITVKCRPDHKLLGTEFAGPLPGLQREFDRLLPQRRVGVGEGAELEFLWVTHTE